MAFYFDGNRRLEWIDEYNLAYQEKFLGKNSVTKEMEEMWKNISYYPNLEMAFKYFVIKEISDSKITNNFEEILDKIAVLSDKYQSLAKMENNIIKQNKKIIEQNEEIIELKKKELDNRLKLDYDVEEDEEENDSGWNY